MYDRSDIKYSSVQGKNTSSDDQTRISKDEIVAVVYWKFSEWNRFLGVAGKLNFCTNWKIELVLLTFALLSLHSFPPHLRWLIIELLGRHIFTTVCSLFLSLGIFELLFFHPFDILSQLEASSFHLDRFSTTDRILNVFSPGESSSCRIRIAGRWNVLFFFSQVYVWKFECWARNGRFYFFCIWSNIQGQNW